MKHEEMLKTYLEGHSIEGYRLFGAHCVRENNEDGVRFTVWAPHAASVFVMGDFNWWTEHRMERINDSVFSVFIKGAKQNQHYKFCVETMNGSRVVKADPYAFYSELRPFNSSIIYDLNQYHWNDAKWLNQRTKNFDCAMNIYEIHAGAWKRHDDGTWLNYEELAEVLIPYLKEYHFTHVELMPLNEHPFDGSWGYQPHGLFSCTSRYGTPDQFMYFVDLCHQNSIGVIMDFVPVHFVKDEFGLVQFDGQPCYEYPYEHDAKSPWGTLNFDVWKEEVRSFLMSAAALWCDKYHVDGLRIDAVSNYIYWGGDKNRGTNEGGLAFLRRMNYYLSVHFPEVMLIAEDSSDFPMVTGSVEESGLGFDYKWDLGWMNDTLAYFSIDPVFRKYSHNKLTFSMMYYYSERFLMPLSHDENVHGKKTIIDKMWGSYEQKFAQVKVLYMYMYTHPGKKLNFMGNELGMFREFDEIRENDWFLLDYSRHAAFARYFKDLCTIYAHYAAFSESDFTYDGFKWINCDNADDNVLTYYRESETEAFVIVLNMSGIGYENYRIGVPYHGKYKELIHTEKEIYEGSGSLNPVVVNSIKQNHDNLKQCIEIRLAPLSGIIFQTSKRKRKKKSEEKKCFQTKRNSNSSMLSE